MASRSTCASAREMMAPSRHGPPAESLWYFFFQSSRACLLNIILPPLRANFSALDSSATSPASFSLSTCPPKGSSRLRLTQTQRKRLAKPLLPSLALNSYNSSSRVICPTHEMCAPLARVGEFLASVDRSPLSQA